MVMAMGTIMDIMEVMNITDIMGMEVGPLILNCTQKHTTHMRIEEYSENWEEGKRNRWLSYWHI